jgi:uncharacterized protein
MSAQTIIWRRLDKPGHEFASVFCVNSCWHLGGTAIFMHDARPCRLDYRLKCDSQWQTLSGKVAGRVGDEVIGVEISVDAQRRWRLNGDECAEAAGCIDLDLNFSPSTNLLPIRRLNLAVGQEADVRAAWLRFPSFRLEPLEQIYHRVETSVYRYESAGGSFVTKLEVDDVGFVTHYPNLWRAEGDA